MHWETLIVQTWQQGSDEHIDALRGHHNANMDAVVE